MYKLGLLAEGIYRKSGTFVQIKDLQDAFEEDRNPRLSKYQDIHVIASVLKFYFRELTTPLLSNQFICKHYLIVIAVINRYT